MDYKQSIKASTADLLAYTNAELKQLAKMLGIPTNLGKRVLATQIATRLVDKHWKRGTMTKEELPYGGDMAKARAARDVKAIMAIQKWLNEQQAERSKAAVAETIEKEKGLPEEAKDCQNPVNFITDEYWSSDDLPDVKITFLNSADPINGPRRTLCYSREGLQKWVEQPSNQMAVWIPNVRGGKVNDDGHGGGPSGQLVTRLPSLNEFIFGTSDFRKNDYIAVPKATEIRIGNRSGALGASLLHGQAPGKTVYELFDKDVDYIKEYRDIFLQDLRERSPMISYNGSILEDLIVFYSDKAPALIMGSIDPVHLETLIESAAYKELKKISAFKSIISDFEYEFQEGELEDAQTELAKIYKLLENQLQKNPSKTLYDAILAILITIDGQKAIDKYYQLFGEGLSSWDPTTLIKGSQYFWNSYPARLQDYDDAGERVETGILYEEEYEGPELEESETESEEEVEYREGFKIGEYTIEPGADLRGADLSGANLIRANLEGAHLEGAHLEDADLQDANLNKAFLQKAFLTGAKLNRAQLKEANLTEAKLDNAKLSFAVLSEANLTKAILHDTNFEDAILEGTNFTQAELDSANLKGTTGERPVFNSAQMYGADLWNADLPNAQFVGAKLQGVILTGAILHEANMLDANLVGANIEGTDFRDAQHLNFSGAIGQPILYEEEYEEEIPALRSGFVVNDHLIAPGIVLGDVDLSNTDLSNADMEGMGLAGANLSGANLTGSFLGEANLTNAILNGANLTRADLTDTEMKGATLQGATIDDAHMAYAKHLDLSGTIGIPGSLAEGLPEDPYAEYSEEYSEEYIEESE